MLLHDFHWAQAEKPFESAENNDEVVYLADADKKIRQHIGGHDNVDENGGDEQLGAGGNPRVFDQSRK